MTITASGIIDAQAIETEIYGASNQQTKKLSQDLGVSFNNTPGTLLSYTAGTLIKFSNFYGLSYWTVPSGVATTLLSTGFNVSAIVYNNYNGYIYYHSGSAVYIITVAGAAVTNFSLNSYTFFLGCMGVNQATGVVYILYNNAGAYGFASIAPGTYTVTYNALTGTTSLPSAAGCCFYNGNMYTCGGQTVWQTSTSTWATSVLYGSVPTSGRVLQGITVNPVNGDIYYYAISNYLYKNGSSTQLVAAADYWGLTTDGINIYFGGAGNAGVWKTVIGTWGAPTNIATSGTSLLLTASIYYWYSKIYFAGYSNKAIILLT
jgi:hypothetical protein